MILLPFRCIDSSVNEQEVAYPWMNTVFLALSSIVTLAVLATNYFVFLLVELLFVPIGWLVHVNLYHMVGNLFLMLVLGNFVNRKMGSLGYFLFVVLCGIGGALFHALIEDTGVVGASAIVFGLMGYLVVVAGKVRFDCTYWIVLFWGVKRLQCRVVVGVLLFGQVVFQILQPENLISLPAHIFGLLFGVVIGFFTTRREAIRALEPPN
ncbi:MAG: rhomboid family intramembrane serine protease [Verrucomicrobiota bacterium]